MTFMNQPSAEIIPDLPHSEFVGQLVYLLIRQRKRTAQLCLKKSAALRIQLMQRRQSMNTDGRCFLLGLEVSVHVLLF